ncbi:MAG TPA: FAD-dependent oxidoreductase [Bacteroidota bacterium]
MHENIRYITAQDYEQEVLRGGNVVLDFYSTECPPCEALAAKFEPLSEVYGKDIAFLKIFRQENRELALSLGVSSSPQLLFYRNGVPVGEKLVGSIRRSDIVRNLELLLPPGRSAVLRSAVRPVETACDLLVIGGGPAGLTAAIYAAQAKVKTIVVDKDLPGGQVKVTHLVSNYPGFHEPVSGYMLMHEMAEQAKGAGVAFRSAVDITAMDLLRKNIVVDGFETITAKKIILATGSSPRPLGVKGEREYKGQGISYCSTCDAKFYEGKDVVVIGGGNSAIEESLFITRFARSVTIVHQFAALQANKAAQEKAFANPRIRFIFEHEPREFVKEGTSVRRVVIEDLRTHALETLACDGVFIFAGMKPNIEEFASLFRLDEFGYIETDAAMHTSVDDIFAIGDVASKRFRQITTAVADGTIAAITASRELEAAR